MLISQGKFCRYEGLETEINPWRFSDLFLDLFKKKSGLRAFILKEFLSE